MKEDLQILLNSADSAVVKTTTGKESDKETATVKRVVNPAKSEMTLERRTKAIVDIKLNGKVSRVQINHDPSRIRMWEMHNREYSLLNKDNCADLIEGFERAGGQQFPAIVRKVEGHDLYDYEVIAGARRHWTATHLKKALLIEVRKLNDKDAFTIQDLENRDRKDISDLERARDYKAALPLYFDGEVIAMAEFLKIDVSNFRRLLYLAELPEEIVSAYSDIREIKTHHGNYYKKLLDDKKSRRALLDRAKLIAKSELTGREVFAELSKPLVAKKEAVKLTFGKATLAKYSSKRLQINLDIAETMTVDQIEQMQKDCSSIIEEAMKQKNEQATA